MTYKGRLRLHGDTVEVAKRLWNWFRYAKLCALIEMSTFNVQRRDRNGDGSVTKRVANVGIWHAVESGPDFKCMGIKEYYQRAEITAQNSIDKTKFEEQISNS
jgi:hypothetical protein